MPDFTEILSKKAIEAEKPRPQPPGNYLAALVGLPKQREIKTKDGDRNVLAFSCKLMAAHSGVDDEKLADMPEISSWMPMSNDIFIDGEQGEWGLRRFLEETLGIDPGTEDNAKSFGEMVAESPGRQLIVTVVNEPYIDKDNQPAIAARIRGTARV